MSILSNMLSDADTARHASQQTASYIPRLDIMCCCFYLLVHFTILQIQFQYPMFKYDLAASN